MKPMISSGGWISTPIDMVRLILSVDGLDKPRDILKKETIKIMSTPPENINSKYAMGMKVTKSGWRHTGECTWGTSAIWYKTNDNLCFAMTCNTLPTITGHEDEKYKAMINYVIDVVRLFPTMTEKITEYPDIDLFDKY